MPIANYQNPGVYVTQVTNAALAGANNNNLNICFLAAAPSGCTPIGPQTDRFLLSSTSGIQTFTLTQAGVQNASVSLTNNTTGATLVSGTDYTTITGSTGAITGFTTISGGSGISGVNGVGANGYIRANYNYTTAVTGNFYTFYDFNSVQGTFGPAFNFSNTTGAVTINSPATLAAYLAFQNGAQSVTCSNITISGGVNTPAGDQDFLNAVYGLVNVPNVDVIVPLK